jgi:hypothetical protein
MPTSAHYPGQTTSKSRWITGISCQLAKEVLDKSSKIWYYGLRALPGHDPGV